MWKMVAAYSGKSCRFPARTVVYLTDYVLPFLKLFWVTLRKPKYVCTFGVTTQLGLCEVYHTFEYCILSANAPEWAQLYYFTLSNAR
jgi:hypothetical protein